MAIDPQEICDKAAEIIRQRGRCRGEMRSEDGRVSVACAIHDAIIELHGWQDWPDPMFEAAKALTMSRSEWDLSKGGLAYTVALTAWNDSSKTTDADVLYALEGKTS